MSSNNVSRTATEMREYEREGGGMREAKRDDQVPRAVIYVRTGAVSKSNSMRSDPLSLDK